MKGSPGRKERRRNERKSRIAGKKEGQGGTGQHIQSPGQVQPKEGG